jgi:hypothetical protein
MKKSQSAGYAHLSMGDSKPSGGAPMAAQRSTAPAPPGLFPRLSLLFCVVVVCVVAGVHSARRSCDTPFGSLIGVALTVPAYSNCNSDYTSNGSAYANISGVPGGAVYSGMPWQCVEYARRFLILTPPHVAFGSVDGASDIWPIATVDGVLASNANSTYPFASFPNGNATSRPRVGDLIIYPQQPGGFPFGHVAVVVGVTRSAIEVGEQNWDSYVWANVGRNFSRQIPLVRVATTGAWVVDDPNGLIAGWKRVMPL